MNNKMIDKSTFIHPSVKIGKNVKIGPNCSIGYEGFEFSRDEDGIPQHVEHRGGVIIEDNVEIYSNAVISRGLGKNDDTIIGKNSKINNLVHIGHNCEIGEGNLLGVGAIVGGSVKIGKNNYFALNCTIRDGIIVGDYNLIGMGSVVIADISNYEVWAGYPARKLRDNRTLKKQR